MDLFDAQVIARKIRAIPNVQVIGVKTIKGERALIISINRRGKKAILEADRAVARVAKAADVHGHWFEKLNVCSLCYNELTAGDGHYHSIRTRLGYTEAVCCNCVIKSGAICSIVATAEKAKRDARRAKWDSMTYEQQQRYLESRRAKKKKAKR